MHRRRPEPRPIEPRPLRGATLIVLASALASCSLTLDFGAFRFDDDAGAAADATGAIDAGGLDAPLADSSTGDEDVAGSDLPAADLGPPDERPPDVTLVDTAPDVGTDIGLDAGFDVGSDAGFDVGSDAGFDAGFDIGFDVGFDVGRDVPVDRGPPDVPLPPPRTCVEVLARGGTASGIYAIDHDADDATATVQVYCDQTREGGGWLRSVDLSNGTSCPAPLMALPSERVCVRTGGADDSVRSFSVLPLIAFREVRGRAALRGRADLDAFGNAPMYLTWDGPFVDGLTVTRVQVVDGGTTRQHVFTWALSASTVPAQPNQACPCAGGSAPIAEVGNRFLCRALVDASRDAGVVDPMAFRDPETPWAGSGTTCTPGAADGSFRTDLGASLRGPLQVRLTLSGPMGATSEEVGIAALELYVR